MSQAVKTVLPPAFGRAAYLRAKVLDSFANQCHEQGLLFDSLNHEEVADADREASAALNKEARQLFPLYPHPDFKAGKQWAREIGFSE